MGHMMRAACSLAGRSSRSTMAVNRLLESMYVSPQEEARDRGSLGSVGRMDGPAPMVPRAIGELAQAVVASGEQSRHRRLVLL